MDGSSTAGMLRACRREYLGLVLRDVASAVEVSRERPEIRGRAKVREVRVLERGRERVWVLYRA